MKTKKQKHVKKNTQNIKTRLTQKQLESKTNKLCKTIKGEREKKWLNHFEPFSFQTLVLKEDPFLELNLCSRGEGEGLKPFKFERNMRALRRSPRGPKDGGI